MKEEEEKLREKFDEALQEHKVELVEADDTSQKQTDASATDSTSVRSDIVVQRTLCFLINLTFVEAGESAEGFEKLDYGVQSDVE